MSTYIPLSVLFGNPERVLPSISPDGEHLAWLAPVDGALNLWLDDRPVTRAAGRGIGSYRWARSGRKLLWVQDRDGDENGHVWCLDLVSSEIVDLTPFDAVRAELVATNASAPDVVLVGLNRRDARVFDLYRIDLDAGSIDLVRENDDVESWLIGRDLEVLGATRMADDGTMSVVAATVDGWSDSVADVGNYLAVLALGVTESGDVILRTDKDAPARYLARLDLDSGELTAVLADATYDVTSATLSPLTGEPEFAVIERDRAEIVVLDRKVQGDIDALAEVHAGRPVILSRTADDRRWVVGYLSDNGPVAHYLWDRDTRTANFLFDHRPEMHEHEWAPMEPFVFVARDGLEIRGYLTFPQHGPRTALPAVVNVHGGPWRRNVWGFDPEAQWLADRGYLCVQVNFRGSAGYGRALLDAGDRQWGAAMQDDLVDAVDHLARLGLVDRRRVGIMGTSYGGYATLCGMAFAPDVFACGVATVGPANLVTFITSLPPYWQPTVELWHRRVGHPVNDAEMLRRRSPLFHVDQIRGSVLLVHGARDPRVPQAESDAMAAALAAAGVDHEYIVFADEGHGITRPENRDAFYNAAARFFGRCLR